MNKTTEKPVGSAVMFRALRSRNYKLFFGAASCVLGAVFCYHKLNNKNDG